METIVCYHGGVVDDDANGQLRRILRETLVRATSESSIYFLHNFGMHE